MSLGNTGTLPIGTGGDKLLLTAMVVSRIKRHGEADYDSLGRMIGAKPPASKGLPPPAFARKFATRNWLPAVWDWVFMSEKQPLIRNVSDTALWVAVYRANETERPDALFRDPYARRLAGPRGEGIASGMPFRGRDSWPFVMRTFLFDQFILKQVEQGTEMVINLGAGLCSRPYRMPLPASLQWIEADLPDIIDYKEEVMADEKTACKLERVRLDLSDVEGRRGFFARIGSGAKKALIITEGVLAYASASEVGVLARDLAAIDGLRSWVLDLASPGLLRMIQKRMPQLGQAGAPLKFGPAEGPGFFVPHGWHPVEVRSLLKAAAQKKRLSVVMRIMALLPQSNGAQGSRPWSGVCLFTKKEGRPDPDQVGVAESYPRLS